MSKTRMIQGLLLGGLLMAGSASAEMKIGYLDVTRVAEESPQYINARKSLQRELDKREQDLRAKAEQLKKLEEKFKRDSAVMSESEVRRLERDILSRQRKLKNSRDEYRDELSLRQNEERQKLLRKVAEVVRKIGKDEGFDLILTPESVAYFNPKIDISDKVLARLKDQ
jgi:outer membrane protein